MIWDALRADLRRYIRNGRLEWWEPSLWVIVSYRLGHWSRTSRRKWLRRLAMGIDAPFYLAVTVLTGIHLPRRAEIGPGLKVWHFGGVFLNPLAKLGRGCTLRQNVCIGNRREDTDVPVLGDFVEVGVGAVILGAIRVGHHAIIGANAVVVQDVPDWHVAVGNPARLLPRRDSPDRILASTRQ